MESSELVRTISRHWDVLNQLRDGEKFTSELAKALGKKLPAISKATSELVVAGLIKSRLSPQKRGGVRKYYSLTNKGKVIVDTILHAKKVPKRREYTKAELDMLKPHWEKLWNSIMLLIKGEYRLYGQSYDVEVGRRYLPDLESHLKTGYPEIYELYEKLHSLREQRDRMRKNIEDEVKALVREEFRTVLSTFKYKNEALQHFARLVIDRMRDVLTEGSLWMDEDRYWEVKENGVWCGGRLLLPPNGSPEEAKKFIVEQSQKLLESYREVFKLEGDMYRVGEELNSKLDDLAKRIESGLHLRGRCKTCEDRPRIVEG